MKKLLFATLVFTSMLVFSTFSVMAEAEIVEAPNVKIVIDGAMDVYENTPLIIEGRTMLPLRELLVNLGVTNDDEHIIWNNDERSVTVVTEDQTIVLQVGNNEATVNGETITLDVAPMIYAKYDRTYIPVRFVSESLGKKVVWDGSTTTVLIAEESSFNRVMELLTLSDTAMTETSKVLALDMTYNTQIEVDGEPQEMAITARAIVNAETEDYFIDMGISMEIMPGVPMDIKTSIYQTGDVMYMMNPLSPGQWIVSDVDETTATSSFDFDAMSVGANESMAAGLVIVEETDTHIVLEGDIYLEDLLNQASSSGITPMDDTMSIDKYHVRLTLNKETYKLEGMTGRMEMTMTEEDGTVTSMGIDIDVTMEALDDDYEIVVPQEVIDNALTNEEAGASMFTN